MLALERQFNNCTAPVYSAACLFAEKVCHTRFFIRLKATSLYIRQQARKLA